MSLDLPVVLGTPGPQYAGQVNAALTTLDAHDHTSGKGVAIPSAGIAPDADLPFNGHSPTGLGSTQYQDRDTGPDGAITQRAVYVQGGDLYYVNGDGVEIQITDDAVINPVGTGGFGGDYVLSGAQANYSLVAQAYTFLNPNTSRSKLNIGALDATGAATIAGAASFASTLSVTGAITASAAINAGAASFSSLGVSGTTTLAATTVTTLAASGQSTLSGVGATSLSVSGTSALNATSATGLTVSGAASTATLAVSGAATLTGTATAAQVNMTGLTVANPAGVPVELKASGANTVTVDIGRDPARDYDWRLSQDTTTNDLAINPAGGGLAAGTRKVRVDAPMACSTGFRSFLLMGTVGSGPTVANGATQDFALYNSQPSFPNNVVPWPFAGSVVGIAVRLTTGVTSNNMAVQVLRNGGLLFTTNTFTSGAGGVSFTQTFAKDLYQFGANVEVSARILNNSGATIASMFGQCYLIVEMDGR